MYNRQLIDYLIDFILGPVYGRGAEPSDGTPTETLGRRQRFVRYTNDPMEMFGAYVVIRPSKFFDLDTYGTPSAYPSLPLAEWEGVPILFGEPRHELIHGGATLVIHADLVASAYFLLSRYEEMYRRDIRDKHGRFPGKASLPYRAGFIHRPIVEEYGAVLRRLIESTGIAERARIRLTAPAPFFSKVNLTHDIDQPYRYRGVKGLVRGLLDGRSPMTMLRNVLGSPHRDPFFTFDQILEHNLSLKRDLPEGMVNTIFFLKTPDDHPLDKPNYPISSRYMRLVRRLADRAGVQYGLHCSYRSGLDPRHILPQRKRLQSALHTYIGRSRHHYLALREPEDMIDLIAAGIRHDYTMGYADVAGFRLGTCRPVRFISPNTRSLTELVLHPLTIMDVTLSRQDFMALDLDEARRYASDLIRQTAQYGGELNLLWHNEQFAPEVHPWHHQLYPELLDLIRDIEAEDRRGQNADSEPTTTLDPAELQADDSSVILHGNCIERFTSGVEITEEL